MKKLITFVALIVLALEIQAQPPAGDALPGEWYGDKISTDGALELRDVAAKLEGGSVFEGDTRIRAKVLDVCPKKGCWLKLEIDENTTATVKMKDYAFFLPLAAKGKTIVLDGRVEMKTTSVAELKHYAEDAKKTKEEIDAIREPKKEVRILAKGIVITE